MLYFRLGWLLYLLWNLLLRLVYLATWCRYQRTLTAGGSLTSGFHFKWLRLVWYSDTSLYGEHLWYLHRTSAIECLARSNIARKHLESISKIFQSRYDDKSSNKTGSNLFGAVPAAMCAPARAVLVVGNRMLIIFLLARSHFRCAIKVKAKKLAPNSN